MTGGQAVTPADFRRLALALPGATEGAHRGHADFRIGTRIFATLGWPDEAWGMVKLTPDEQKVLVEAEPGVFERVPGGWGRQGSTQVRLETADEITLSSALAMAWRRAASKRRGMAR